MKKYALAIILFVALFMRLYGIRWGLPNSEHFYSYYPDEYNVIHTLQTVKPSQFNFTPPFPMWNPTFYYFLVGSVVKFASVLDILTLTSSKQFYLFNPDEYAKIYLIGRILIAIMGVLTVFLVYLIGKKFYSQETGLGAAAVFSIIPLNVVSSHYMEPAVAVTFWLTLTMFFSLNIIASGKIKWYILAGISCGFAIGSKYTAIPFVAIVTIAHILRKDTVINRKIFLFYITTILIFIIGTPYSVLDFATFKSNILPFFERSTKGVASIRIDWLYPIHTLLYYGLGLPVLILSLCGVAFALIKRQKCDILLLSWILFYYYIQGQAGFKIIRYQNEYAPFLIILAVRFIFQIKNYAYKIVLPVTLVITLIYSLSYTSMMTEQTPQDESSEWIKNNIKAGSKIAVIRKPYYYSPPVINMKYFALSRYAEKPIYNKPDYKIIDIDYDRTKLEKEKPDYIVTSDIEFVDNLPKTPESKLLLHKMFSSGEYTEIKRFETQPTFLIFSFKKKKDYPVDWKMLCPTIIILKREKQEE